jgi:hypothetical protein
VLLLFIASTTLISQSLQLQYDFLHSIDPQNNKSNYPTLFYEFFKNLDDGAFFVKTESDFYGENNNIGQLYFQIFREFRFWDPPVSIHVEYNGGLGIAEGTTYGYYLNHELLLGGNIRFSGETMGKVYPYVTDTTSSQNQATICNYHFIGERTFGKINFVSPEILFCLPKIKIRVMPQPTI